MAGDITFPGGPKLKSYIVRIYRCEKNNSRSIVGMVEEPEVEGKRAFTNLDELWRILNPRSAKQETKTIRGSRRS